MKGLIIQRFARDNHQIILLLTKLKALAEELYLEIEQMIRYNAKQIQNNLDANSIM